MLHFDEASHTYTWAGQKVPSVTQILEPIKDYDGIPAAILNKARERGQKVHLATELDDKGSLDPDSVSDEIRPYLEAWRAFKRDRGVVVLEIEARVYNAAHGYAGTLDRVIGIPEQGDYLIDVKATASIKAAVGPQTAAYKEAYGAKELKRGVVQLCNDGTYKFRELPSPRDWMIFQACHLIHKYRKEAQDVL
jgi:hypothetical protein